MASPIDDRKRAVVPRWRGFHKTLGLGELLPLSVPPSKILGETPAPIPPTLAKLRADFDARPGPAVAGDLLSAAAALGRTDVVEDVANRVLRWDYRHLPSLSNMAMRVLGMPLMEATPLVLVERDGVSSNALHLQMRRIKGRLSTVPRNAFDWIDAALFYETMGQRDQASRAVRAALSLARANRFIVRSAARFWAHRDDHEQAHALLMGTPGLQSDPWLVAAEIAVATAGGMKPQLMKMARQWIGRGGLHPFHLSEMASAVGTVELQAGGLKQARRMFRASIESPTENAVAQAAWADRSSGSAFLWEMNPRKLLVSAEAEALSFFQDAEWDASLRATQVWLADQPFSARPVINASFLFSSVMDDQQAAIAVCRFGIATNPENAVIRNNLAFAYALAGRLDEAESALRSNHLSSAAPVHQAVLSATKGLIAFRRGALEVGRAGYGQAIRYFERNGMRDAALRARLHLAVEEARVGNEEVRKEADSIMAAASKTKDVILRATLTTLRRALLGGQASSPEKRS